MGSPFQTMQPVNNVFTLPRCDVSLYEQGEDYAIGSLVWTAQQVENLRLAESYERIETRTTGIPYPEPHHMAERHQITFDAIWNVSAVIQRNIQYVLAVTWREASLAATPSAWRRRIYYGVTLPSREVTSRNGEEFGSTHTLEAKFYDPSNGTGTPPTPS